MKNLFKSIFLMVAVSSLLSASCKKTPPPKVIIVNKPTLIINDGATSTIVSSSIDTIHIKLIATADTDRKISNLKITRVMTGSNPSTVVIKDSSLGVATLIYTYADIIAGTIGLEEFDVLRYTVAVTDDKGNMSSGTFVVTISNLAVSGQLLIGGPTSSNEYRCMGISDNFRKYRSGSTGADLAKDNSSKVDFVFLFDAGGAVGNALYSPDYAIPPIGWTTEIANWPTRNKTIFVFSDLTASQFDALSTDFLPMINSIDFAVGGVGKVSNLSINNVYAYKRANGKRGFIKIGQTANNASGQILLIIKSEL